MNDLAGILNIDKPAGMTSHDVVNRVRRTASTRRVGHAGTLDPLATGVLLVCVGRATRLVEYLVGQPKVYEAEIRLGQTTNTYDADGEVVQERPLTFTPQDLQNALTHFLGEIEQVPPMYSAIKQDGQPLYKLARQGKEVERKPRLVTIHELAVLSWNAPLLAVRVACSTGTYIRSLAHDLGEVLGCGGHITRLRRTAVGDFSVETAVSLNDLSPENIYSHLLPLDTAVAHLPRLDLTNEDAHALLQGKPISSLSPQPPQTVARAYNPQAEFIGVVSATTDGWRAKKMFHPQENDNE